MNDSKDLITLYGKTYSVAKIAKIKDEFIKLEAIYSNFALEQLSHDKSPLIRSAVARKMVGHEHLCIDLNWRVRATVAQYCIDSEIIYHLAQDENDFIRYIIAKRGFAPEILINDSDPEIMLLAKSQLHQAEAA